MSDDSTTECLLFPGIFFKPVIAQFDQREGSSDGGELHLKAANQHYRLVKELTAGLLDGKTSRQGRSYLAGLSRTAGVLNCLWLSRRQPTRPDWAATPFTSCFSVRLIP